MTTKLLAQSQRLVLPSSALLLVTVAAAGVASEVSQQQPAEPSPDPLMSLYITSIDSYRRLSIRAEVRTFTSPSDLPAGAPFSTTSAQVWRDGDQWRELVNETLYQMEAGSRIPAPHCQPELCYPSDWAVLSTDPLDRLETIREEGFG